MFRLPLGNNGLRFECAGLLITPILLVVVSIIVGPLLQDRHSSPPSSLANRIQTGVAIYFLVAPLIVEFTGRRSRQQPLARNQLILIMGAGGSGAIAGMGFLAYLGGFNTLERFYFWALVSFVAAVGWTWRYRWLLR